MTCILIIRSIGRNAPTLIGCTCNICRLHQEEEDGLCLFVSRFKNRRSEVGSNKQTSFRSPDPYPRTGIRRYLLSSWQVHGFTRQDQRAVSTALHIYASSPGGLHHTLCDFRWQDQREMVIENGRDVIQQLKDVQVSDDVSVLFAFQPRVEVL